ncbi:hypothetical protein PT974_04948 [Cladobotryum mycophilum]|uniref:Uncharacterized protein n=1 Tax=Cladobotryum mycophilum TaxID=491253 RepID=A0ABR0SQU2_9HYPO
MVQRLNLCRLLERTSPKKRQPQPGQGCLQMKGTRLTVVRDFLAKAVIGIPDTLNQTKRLKQAAWFVRGASQVDTCPRPKGQRNAVNPRGRMADKVHASDTPAKTPQIELHWQTDTLLSRRRQIGSGSKVGYKDWLLLKVLWKEHKTYLTHDELFGKLQDLGRVTSLQTTSQNLFDMFPWYQAFESNQQDPTTWLGLAAWKQSVNTITRRLAIHDSMKESLNKKVSGEALFSSVKLWMEPELGESDESESQVDSEEGSVREGDGDGKQVMRLQRSSHGEWSRPLPIRPGPSMHGKSSQSESSDGSQADHSEETDKSQPSSRGKQPSVATSASYIAGTLKNPPDEEIINMSLVLLLQGLCMYNPAVSNNIGWYGIRMAFSIEQAKTKIMTARTDGCLQLLQDGILEENCPTLAIIEVKPHKRVDNRVAIQMQEGAEMAAWISSKPFSGEMPKLADPERHRRVIISQDFNEIFIIIAEYDDEYVDYITGSNATRDSPEPQTGAPSSKPSQQSTPARPKTPESKRPVQSGGAPMKSQAFGIPQAGTAGSGTKGFLTMHQYPGFNVNDPRHMKRLIPLLLSVTHELYRANNLQARQ